MNWDAKRALEIADKLVTPSGTTFFDDACWMLRAAVTETELWQINYDYTAAENEKLRALEDDRGELVRQREAADQRAGKALVENDRLAAENEALRAEIKYPIEERDRWIAELALARAVVEAAAKFLFFRSDESNLSLSSAIAAYDAHVAKRPAHPTAVVSAIGGYPDMSNTNALIDKAAELTAFLGDERIAQLLVGAGPYLRESANTVNTLIARLEAAEKLAKLAEADHEDINNYPWQAMTDAIAAWRAIREGGDVIDYWVDPHEGKCDECGKNALGTLEPIGPTTGFTCLECQKTAPSRRTSEWRAQRAKEQP